MYFFALCSKGKGKRFVQQTLNIKLFADEDQMENKVASQYLAQSQVYSVC